MATAQEDQPPCPFESRLRQAILEGRVSDIHALVRSGASVTVANPETGWTALHFAACFGESADVVAAILEHGADVAALTRDRESTLDLACADRVPSASSGGGAGDGDDVFELLRRGLDERTERVAVRMKRDRLWSPFPLRRSYPSKFLAELEMRREAYIRMVSPTDFEDSVYLTRHLRRDGLLGDRVPYPDERPYLAGESVQAAGVSPGSPLCCSSLC